MSGEEHTFSVPNRLMKRILLLLFGLFFVGVAGCQSVDSSPSTGVDQHATIEGLSTVSLLLSPIVKLNWPDLRRFEIIGASGAGAKFSSSEARVLPGPCTITITAEGDWHDEAVLHLRFEPKASGRYVVRPVYRGRTIECAIQDTQTREIVARSWTQDANQDPRPIPKETPQP